MEPLHINIEFQSDFMVCTGYGIAGIIDNTVVKTENRMPYIPGTTIKGNIRRSCEEIALMLGMSIPQKNDDPESDPEDDSKLEIAKIFGTSFMPAGITFNSAYPNNVYSLDYFADRLVNVEKHNQIDIQTGTALENHFFSHETSTKKLEFEFCLNPSLGYEPLLGDKEKALLVAGILFTDRIGGKKSRGRGKCRLSMKNEKWEAKTCNEWIDQIMKARQ